jgi:hypothetical protein
MKFLYSKASTGRNKNFQIYTQIVEDDKGEKYSLKRAVYREGEEHLKKIRDNYMLLRKINEDLPIECEMKDEFIRFPYVEGQSWKEKFLFYLDSDEKIKEFLDEWKILLIQSESNICRFEKTDEYEKIFGNSDSYFESDALKITNFDCILENIFDTSHGIKVIDYEWVFDFPIPLELTWYRLVKCLYDGKKTKISFPKLLNIADLDIKKIFVYESSLRNFEKYISYDSRNGIDYWEYGSFFKHPKIMSVIGDMEYVYDFPRDLFQPESKIVIYGAGKVGQDWYRTVKNEKLCKISGWVDKNYRKYKNIGLEVDDIALLSCVEFDYILVAISNRDIYLEIYNELIDFGIDKEKIIWTKPIL